MSTRIDADVIVVGGGPIGLVAALLLADAGVRTIVIEQESQPGDLPRAISLQDESLRTFDRLGIAEALKSESLLDTGSRYYGRADRLLLEAKPASSRLGQPAKSQFDQPILEALLWDRAVAHDRIEFLTGTPATALAHDTDHVSVTATVEGRERTFVARWLIGADGGRSFTRTSMSIDLVGTTQPQRWIVVDLLNDVVERDPFAEFHCDGERPYVLVPGVDGRLRIEFMLFDGEDAETMTSPERIAELVVPRFRPVLHQQDVRRAAVYVAHQRIARSYRAGRGFLIGDAAHLMPPFAGQGLNAGVRDAANLAWKLVEAVRGGASDRLLDSYEVERRAHAAKMVAISYRIGRVVMATNPVVTRLRDALVRALSTVPRVRAFLASMRFITPPDYAKGITVGDRTLECGQERVGRALSQPIVRDASGVEAPLDHHLGPGWALLQIGGVQDEAVSDYWRAIGVTQLRVLRPGERPGTRAVAETIRMITADDETTARFVLVRPDRYVAAIFDAGDEDRVVSEMRAFIDDTARLVAERQKENA